MKMLSGKNITISFLLLTGLCFSAYSQTEIPKGVQQAFQNKFAAATNVTWEEVDGTYIVSFEEEDYYKDASFSSTGLWLNTSTYLSENELPKPIIKTIAAKIQNVEYYNTVLLYESPKETYYIIGLELATAFYNLKMTESGEILEQVKELYDNDERK